MLNIIHQFDDDTLERLARMISEDISSCVLSRTNWMTSVENCCLNYLGRPDEDRVLPWDGASDIFIPMTMIAMETTHPRILNGILGLDQTVTAEPTSGASAQVAERVSNFMNWTLQSHSQVDCFNSLDRVLHSSSLFGRSYSSLSWDKNIATVTRRYTVPRYQAGAGALMTVLRDMKAKLVGPKSLEVPYSNHIQNIIGSNLINVLDMVNKPSHVEITFKYMSDDRVNLGEAIIPTPEDGRTTIDIFITVDELQKNAATLRPVNVADFYHPVDELDLNTASYVAERYWLDLEELYRLKQDGLVVINDDDWYNIVKFTGINSDEYNDFNMHMGIRDARPAGVNTSSESNVRDVVSRLYGDKDTSDAYVGVEMISYHRRMRFGSVTKDYIFWYLPDYDIVCRIVELGVESPTGRRPYHAWEFMRALDDSTRSMGIGHIIMDLQAIINEIFNKQIDRDDLLTMPFGFYRPTSFTKGEIKLEPGLLIPTNDPAAINFPSFNRPTGADMPYIQQLLEFTERLTNATNYFQGSAPQRPNAPRTFGATAAIIQEGNINFNLHIKRYQKVMYSLCRDIQGFYRHFMPSEMEFVAPGADELTKISRNDLNFEYAFVFKSNASNTNPAVRQQMSMVVYQALIMNPLIQTSVKALHNITRRFAINHDYIEFDQDVPKPAPEMSHAPMSQLEEIEAMRHGQNMAVLPIDNHEEHIQVISQFMESDHVMNTTPQFMAMLTAHLQQHQQMAAMMQRAQMLQGGNGVQPGIGSNPGAQSPMGAETGNPGAV